MSRDSLEFSAYLKAVAAILTGLLNLNIVFVSDYRIESIDKMESDFKNCHMFLVTILNKAVCRGSFPHCKLHWNQTGLSVSWSFTVDLSVQEGIIHLEVISFSLPLVQWSLLPFLWWPDSSSAEEPAMFQCFDMTGSTLFAAVSHVCLFSDCCHCSWWCPTVWCHYLLWLLEME